ARAEAENLAGGPTDQPLDFPPADADRSSSLLADVVLDLPEATPDLVPLAKANLAVVPAFVVGDTTRPAGPLASPDEPGTTHDLALTSFVIGLEDPTRAGRLTPAAGCPEPPASPRSPTAVLDQLFSEGPAKPEASSVPAAVTSAEGQATPSAGS